MPPPLAATVLTVSAPPVGAAASDVRVKLEPVVSSAWLRAVTVLLPLGSVGEASVYVTVELTLDSLNPTRSGKT